VLDTKNLEYPKILATMQRGVKILKKQPTLVAGKKPNGKSQSRSAHEL
jgi:hypothetical protein